MLFIFFCFVFVGGVLRGMLASNIASCSLKNINMQNNRIFVLFLILYTIYKNWNKTKLTRKCIGKGKHISLKVVRKKNNYRCQKIYFIILIFVNYHALSNFKSQWVYSSDQPPNFAGNYIADASKVHSFFLHNRVLSFSISKLRLYSSRKQVSSYALLLLLQSGDIERHPGPENWYSLRHPNMCGYFRTAVYFVFSNQKLIPKSEKDKIAIVDIEEGFQDLKNLYGECFNAHQIELKLLKKNIARFMDTNKKWGKDKNEDKCEYYEFFSPVNWQKMDDSLKKKHSVICTECIESSSVIQGYFPSTTPKFKTNRMKNPIHVLNETIKNVQQGKKHNLDCTNEITTVLDTTFQKAFGVSFNESYKKCNNLEAKKTPEERRKLKRVISTETCKKLEFINNSTAVDRLWGGRQSMNQWDFQRKVKCFESVPEARKRTSAEKSAISSGTKKAKNHIGSFSSYDIKSHDLENLALSWTNETVLAGKWNSIGRAYITDKKGKIPANCGQIAKDYLLKQEEEKEFKFTFKGKDDPKKDKVRRARKRVVGRVSVPAGLNSKGAKVLLNEEIASGKIDIGIHIVSRTYKKLAVDKITGEVHTSEFTVDGRKHPLRKIREKLLEKHRKYMRLNPDAYFQNIESEELMRRLRAVGELNENEDFITMREKLRSFERSRNLQMWHDASTVSNHSHILFCVNVMYDPAVFFTRLEYKNTTGHDVNIQREIEKPELYIIGRCRSNDEQLGYIETRLECLRELNKGICVDGNKDLVLTDTMRFFHGDGPSVALESGNQKGGHYFCPCCNVHLAVSDDIGYCYQQKSMTFDEMRGKIIEGTIGCRNSIAKKTKPFSAMTAIQIRQELQSRKINCEKQKTTKKDLVPILKRELKGRNRVPVLLFNNPLVELNLLGLSNYEIVMIECMHDIAGHIDNLLEELPHHMSENDKSKITEILIVYNAEKEQKRCCDRRKILVTLTHALYGKINGKIHRLLKTLSEIQRILYLNDEFRTPKEILRLHNCCFEHFVLLNNVIGFELQNISRDKLYGKYMHNLLVHAPLQYRLVSGESINCEAEERYFNSIKRITKGTSNNRPGHLIGNLIVRQQVESRCNDEYVFCAKSNTVVTDINMISKLLDDIQNNSLFTYDFIKNNAGNWQSHLERISDFLLLGEGVWWQKNEFGIEFFDCHNQAEKSEPLNPKVHHFRSSNISTVTKDLEVSWNSILETNVKIPIHKILEGSEDETVRCRPTSYLNDKIQIDSSPKINERIDEVDDDLITSCSIIEKEDSIQDTIDFEENITSPSKCAISGTSSTVANSSANTLINKLETKEGNAIYFVLGEFSYVLKQYDHEKVLFKDSQKQNEFISPNHCKQMSFLHSRVQALVLDKLSKLETDLENWERSFLCDNDFCVPTVTDRENNHYIADIVKRIKVGNQLMTLWGLTKKTPIHN